MDITRGVWLILILLGYATAGAAALREDLLLEAIRSAEVPALKLFLMRLQDRVSPILAGGDAAARQGAIKEVAVAVKVAGQISSDKGAYPLANAPLTYYAVPAISTIKRLPDVFPSDGKLCGTLQVIAAWDEFEPASFVIFPFEKADKAEIKVSALTSTTGAISATCVDLKVVKCWYQGGTAWYSYFADATGRELVPELLLNDESLVQVDRIKKENYLRVDYPSGSRYVWISNPMFVDIPFNAEKEPVADAETLQPFQLAAGEFKQFWVTVHVPKGAVPGLYRGTVEVVSNAVKIGAIPIVLRVLPFELPRPRTNYDWNREFYTMLYNEPGYATILQASGGDPVHADKKMLALYENMRKHNILHPVLHDFNGQNWSVAVFARQLELLKKARLATDPLFGGVPGIPDYGWMMSDAVQKAPSVQEVAMPEGLKKKIDESFGIVRNLFGHSNVYCFGWDEPFRSLVLAERRPWKYLHEQGLKVFSTGHDEHLKYAGYNEDYCNSSGKPLRERAEKWHSFGGRITTYAGPHTGPENPDYMRRAHGLQLYKANYDGIGNYILSCSQWNDFIGEEYNFRAFNMTYPTRDGVIDTIEWEGMREAVDDVRYAAQLKQLAYRAIASGKVDAVYAGRKALQWLGLLDENTVDLNATRLEMINYIMQLNDMQ